MMSEIAKQQDAERRRKRRVVRSRKPATSGNPELSDSVLSDSEPKSATNETATSYETAEFNSKISSARATGTPDKPNALARKTQKKKSPRRLRAAKPISSIAIQTEQDSENEQLEDDAIAWKPTLRGIPSWLTSLIFHLTLIMALALMSFNNGGSKIVNLFAAPSDAVDIEEIDMVDVSLETVELESALDEVDAVDTKLTETTDLEPLLDEALLQASIDSQTNEGLLDGLSSQQLSKGDLPSKNGGAQFFGVSGEGSDFVFIVDCSGSMADYGRWGQAVRELKKSIGEMKSNQKFLILLYNTGFVAMNDDAKLVEATERERQRAYRWLGRSFPNNWTFCAEALEKALSLEPHAIFLLSDGEFNDRQEVFEVLYARNRQRPVSTSGGKQVPIHTIALGSHLGRFTMKRIADENAGKFRLVE